MPKFRAKIKFVGFEIFHPTSSTVTYANSTAKANEKAKIFEKEAREEWQRRFDSDRMNEKRLERRNSLLCRVQESLKSAMRPSSYRNAETKQFAREIYDMIKDGKEGIDKEIDKEGVYV